MSATKPRKKTAHSDQSFARKPRRRPALKLLALPRQPEMRQVILYEVIRHGQSLHLGLDESIARLWIERYNECLPDDPATLVERPAVIASIGAEGGGQ